MSAGPFKIVILGEGRVGKTSLLRRFVKGNFDEQEASTQSAAYLEKTVRTKGRSIQLSLWDTAGQERFQALAPIYYRDADGALLVYDVTDVQSFNRVAKWVEELKVNGAPCALAIVGNKIDLQLQACVQSTHAEKYARSIGAAHSHASAKLGQGVEEAFTQLALDVLDRSGGAPQCRGGSAPAGGRNQGGRGLVITNDDVRRRQKREKCCPSH